jgi:hypothetical protein
MYNRELGQQILEDAINAFKKATNLEIENVKPQPQVPERIDATLVIRTQDRVLDYLVEIKPTVTAATIGMLAHHFRERPGRWLLVTRHATVYLAKHLKDLGIAFIDTVGNAYINEYPIYIYIRGNRPGAQTADEDGPRAHTWDEYRLGTFGRAGLHIIFALLCNHNLENANYRDIAKAANVALGAVGKVLKGLIQEDYLLDKGTRGRRLIRKKQLLDKWVTEYAEKLWPRQLIGRYETKRFETVMNVDLIRFNAQWGGEIAAEKMTHYLTPEIITIYAQRPINELILELELRRKAEGRVEIHQRFWGFQDTFGERDIVHPILIYADLLATGNTRNVETGRILYDRFIAQLIGNE